MPTHDDDFQDWMPAFKRPHGDLKPLSAAVDGLFKRLSEKCRPKRSEWQVDYREYINSGAWQTRRSQFRNSVGEHNWVCWRCGITREGSYKLTRHGLEVHHKTYDRLGAELDEDLEVLCHFCHEKETYHAHTDDTKDWWKERGFNKYGEYVGEEPRYVGPVPEVIKPTFTAAPPAEQEIQEEWFRKNRKAVNEPSGEDRP